MSGSIEKGDNLWDKKQACFCNKEVLKDLVSAFFERGTREFSKQEIAVIKGNNTNKSIAIKEIENNLNLFLKKFDNIIHYSPDFLRKVDDLMDIFRRNNQKLNEQRMAEVYRDITNIEKECLDKKLYIEQSIKNLQANKHNYNQKDINELKNFIKDIEIIYQNNIEDISIAKEIVGNLDFY